MKKYFILSISIFFISCAQQEFSKTSTNTKLDTPNEEGVVDKEPNPDDSKAFAESFLQKSSVNKVDILFIVDNSISMKEEQRELGTKINKFLGTLDGVDWQIGITTTDVSSGMYGLQGGLLTFSGTSSTVLTKNVANYASKFLQTVVRSETISCNTHENCPSSDEQPINAAIMALLKSKTENKALFRSEASLAIVILSDEDELSTGPDFAAKPQKLIDTFKGLWGPSKILSGYAIVIEPNDDNCLNAQNGYYGFHATDLAKLTGGLTGSICDADYSHILTRIGERVYNLAQAIELKYLPAKDSVKVKLIPAQNNIKWSIEGKKVMFSQAPKEGTQILVDYLTE